MLTATLPMPMGLEQILAYAAYGGIGAVVGLVAKTRRLELPRVVRRQLRTGDHSTHLDVGFLAAPLLGAVLAVLFDTSAPNAIAWGLASGYVGPALLNAIIDPILARLGRPLDVPARPARSDQ